MFMSLLPKAIVSARNATITSAPVLAGTYLSASRTKPVLTTPNLVMRKIIDPLDWAEMSVINN